MNPGPACPGLREGVGQLLCLYPLHRDRQAGRADLNAFGNGRRFFSMKLIKTAGGFSIPF